MLPLLILAAAAAPAAPVPYDYGQPVSYSDGVQIGEQYIKSLLKDPESAQFQWSFNFVPFSEKIPLSKRTTGYATCVTFNAKNSLGGYAGSETDRIIIRNGTVIDIEKVSNLKIVGDICQDLREKYGMGPAPLPRQHLGVSFSPGASGITIMSVQPHSVADLSGLKVGQVVSVINGISVAGRDAVTVQNILAAAPDEVAFRLASGQVISVDRGTKPTL